MLSHEETAAGDRTLPAGFTPGSREQVHPTWPGKEGPGRAGHDIESSEKLELPEK